MNTEELYIWNYGIGKLPKGLLEFGRSDVCDTYDESKRQKFQNHGQWMWKTRMDGEKIYHQSYTSYATKNRESCNLIFLINTV